MIRLATIADIPVITDLGIRLVSRSDFAHTTPNRCAMTDRFLHAIRSKSEWLGVAEHDGKIVGSLLLVVVKYWWTRDEHYVLDDGLYCERPGAGAALIRAGLRWASRLNVKEVLLAVNSGFDIDRTARVMNRCGLQNRGITVSMRVDGVEARRWAA